MLILYYGSDPYRLHNAIDAFVAAHTNAFIIDCAHDDAAEQLERPLKYDSFFAEHKLIIARNGACDIVVDVVKRYAIGKANEVTLVAVQDTSVKTYDKKALASLSKTAERSQAFEPLSGQALSAWVREFCAERNASIETPAITALIQRTGPNTWLLANELEKLCSYVGPSAINLVAVHALVSPRYDQDEWELSNALAALDKRAAITALWRRLQEGTSEQMLLGSLAAGIRNVMMVNDLQSRHQPSTAIAKLTGLHPFVISKTIRGAAKANGPALRTAQCSIANLDRDAKDGRADTVDGLFAALLSL